MKIGVIGTGYVGLVTGTCFADFGQTVVCMDTNEQKIENLKQGILPIYEPGLEELVTSNMKMGRLSFTTDLQNVVRESEIIFIAVGTPPRENGDADLSHVLQVAEDLACHLNKMTVIVNKSTVPIGTGEKVRSIIQKKLDERKANVMFDVVSNPEFLREGVAIEDFKKPDRIVIGSKTQWAADKMKEVYAVWCQRGFPVVLTGIESAEMIKYASNAFLAIKVSYINQIAQLCEAVDANVLDVANGMGLDKRIGRATLHAGAGYGGSCFPKDTRALLRIGEQAGLDISLVRNAIEANELQREKLVQKIEKRLGTVESKRIAILGLAFKPQTDDMREAPAVSIIKQLLKKGAQVATYDPVAMDNSKQYYFCEDEIDYAETPYEAARGADALVIMTEWNEFGSLDFKELQKTMNRCHFFDFRNMYSRKQVESAGFSFDAVGI